MASIPRLAPRVTLNLIDGDQYTLRITLTDDSGARVDLTDCKAAWQVRKERGSAALLTLTTPGNTGYANSTGCSITILNQAVAATKGQLDATFDLKQNALSVASFAEVEQEDGSTAYQGIHDLEIIDSGGLSRTYLRGTAAFHFEVTEPSA